MVRRERASVGGVRVRSGGAGGRPAPLAGQGRAAQVVDGEAGEQVGGVAGEAVTSRADKGSGLAVVAELLAGALTGAGTSARREREMVNTMCSIYVDPDRLPERAAFDAEADALVEWVKASPPAAPGGEVLLPGDLERRTRALRQAQGIPLDATTISEITATALALGLARDQVEQVLR
jgi:uncharacterized oxidoreductase